MPIDEKKISRSEQAESQEKAPEAKAENVESLRERIRAFATKIKEAFSVFSSQKKSAEGSMQSMDSEASFTPDEQAELARIEASAQAEAEKAGQSLETLEASDTAEQVEGGEKAEQAEGAQENSEKNNITMEKTPIQNAEVPAPQEAQQVEAGGLSLEAILNKAEGQIAVEKQEVSAEEESKEQERGKFQEQHNKAAEAYREKNAENEKLRAIIEGELLYAVEAGKNELIAQKSKAMLENRKAEYLEVGKYDPDVVLQTPRGKDRESWNASQARRVEDEMNDPQKFKDAVESDIYSAQRALMGRNNPNGYGAGNIERFVHNPKDVITAIQQSRQKRIEQGLSIAWWTNADGKLEHGKPEELKKNQAEYQKVVGESERIDDDVYKPKERALGFGKAALESNDFDTALYAFQQFGLFENPQALEVLNQKVQQLSEAKDPKLSVLVAKLREVKAGG